MSFKSKLACSIVSIGILLSIILIPLSIHTIGPEDYGIEYDSIWKTINSQILTEGKQILKPTSKVITFPRIFIPIDFTSESDLINCVSRDGMRLQIELTTQYRLLSNNLIDLLLTYDNMLDTFMRSVAMDCVIETCSLFEIEDGFILGRQQVTNKMMEIFKQKIEFIGLNVDTQFLEMKNVVYPPTFLQAITNKQNALQQKEISINERSEKTTIVSIKLMEEIKNSEIALIEKKAEADSRVASAKLKAETVLNKMTQLTSAYNLTKERLNMSGDDFVNYYLTTLPLGTSTNTMIVGY
jgi:regulator of protease activity HflC (stomatin/prohibitin superfamily)